MCGLPRSLRPPVTTIDKITRYVGPNKEHVAIVYEYVEEGENDAAAVEEVLNFFWITAFSFTIGPAARNWKGGVLVDLSDIMHPDGYGWNKALYKERTTEMVLIPEVL